jgi:hypothetical protein
MNKILMTSAVLLALAGNAYAVEPVCSGEAITPYPGYPGTWYCQCSDGTQASKGVVTKPNCANSCGCNESE